MKLSKEKKGIRAGFKCILDYIEKLPDEEAADIFNKISETFDEATHNERELPGPLLVFAMGPAMGKPDPGRPFKTEGLNLDIIFNPVIRERVITILRSEAIKRKSNIAHLAKALINLKFLNWQKCPSIDFFNFATSIIGEKAGTYNGFKSALAKIENNKPKNNRNTIIIKEITRFEKLLKSN